MQAIRLETLDNIKKAADQAKVSLHRSILKKLKDSQAAFELLNAEYESDKTRQTKSYWIAQYRKIVPLYPPTAPLIEISDAEALKINHFLNSTLYTCHCGRPACTTNIMTCQFKSNEATYKNYNYFNDKKTETETALNNLVEAPFRQSRNAYGWSSSLFTGLNVLYNNITTNVPIIGAIISIIAVPLSLGLVVYNRGKNEEQKINKDYAAKLFEQKYKFHKKHSNQARQIIENKSAPRPTALIDDTRNAMPPSEKRHPILNPAAHFVGATTATGSMVFTIIKFGLLASVISLSGPVGIGIAVGVGVAIGAYFFYKRYCHLKNKIKYETHFSQLDCMNANQANIELNDKSSQQNALENAADNVSERKNEITKRSIKIPTPSKEFKSDLQRRGSESDFNSHSSNSSISKNLGSSKHNPIVITKPDKKKPVIQPSTPTVSTPNSESNSNLQRRKSESDITASGSILSFFGKSGSPKNKYDLLRNISFGKPPTPPSRVPAKLVN